MKSSTKSNIPKERVEFLVSRHFGGSAVSRITELTEGMYNSAYLIQGDGMLSNGIVLKVGPSPSTEILTYEEGILRTEVGVLEQLDDRPIRTPRVLAYDFSRRDVPADYFFMQRMPGIAWKKVAKRIPKSDLPGLMRELGRSNAAVHSVHGDWFGYVKEDERFRFDRWSAAFSSMMADVLADGRRRCMRLPYDQIAGVIAANTSRLDEVAKPRLVDFDMWAGNVLIDHADGYRISGVIDFERCFYGDPFADFTSAMQIFSDVEREPDFAAGYAEVSGDPVVVTDDDRIRMDLYRLYMAVILCVETYRYGKLYGSVVRRYATGQIDGLLRRLRRL